MILTSKIHIFSRYNYIKRNAAKQVAEARSARNGMKVGAPVRKTILLP
jgi:hypothetical protein